MTMPEAFLDAARAVNNWGRWGDSDERGTLNLITDEVVRRGAACVRDGRRFQLGIPLTHDSPQIGAIRGRLNPLRTMVALQEPLTGDADEVCFSDDLVVMGLQAATHWDALAHASYGGRHWNGIGAGEVTTLGAARGGIDKTGPIVGRGVLLDIARTLGVERLAPNHFVTPEDLDAAAEQHRVDVQPGDIVLIRTGQMQVLHAGRRKDYAMPGPGPVLRTARWFRDKDVAAVATDTFAFEALPGDPPELMFPVHLLDLVEMGLTQGQNWDLEALAADCADDGRYSFFLDATPQRFVGGLGSPVNPVAVK
jgi:kynurenine formamidase